MQKIGGWLKPPKQQPLGSFASDIAVFFQRRGFTLHRSCHPGGDGQDHTTGGLGLTEEPGGSVLVGWNTHNTMRYADGWDETVDTVADQLSVFTKWL